MTNPLFYALTELHSEYKFSLLKSVLTKKENRTKVLAIIADHFGITPEELVGDDTKDKYCTPRHFGVYLYLNYTTLFCRQIAEIFGYKSHRVIYHVADKISGLIEVSEDYNNHYEAIKEDIITQLCFKN